MERAKYLRNAINNIKDYKTNENEESLKMQLFILIY